MKYAGPLKHYRHKRFLYRFLLMDSPRSAGILGAGLILLPYACAPAFILLTVIMLHHDRLFGLPTEWNFLPMLLLHFVIPLFVLLGGVFIAAGKYDGIRHRKVRDWLTAAFWRKNWSAAFLLPAVALIVLGRGATWVIPAVLVCAVLRFLFAPDDRPLKAAAFLPAALTFLISLGVFGAQLYLDRTELPRLQLRLARLIAPDAPATVEEFDARETGGLSLHEEPLKSMKEDDRPFSKPWYQTPEEARADLAAFREEHPKFVAATERLLALPVGFIREEFGDFAASGDYQWRCWILRDAAHYEALRIRGARDKAEVVRADAALRKLREWCLNSHSLIARMVAGSIESLRLQSVAGTLPRIAWSRDEYVALLGNEPDWEAAYRRSAGDETLIFLRFITPWTDKIRSTPAGLYFTLNLRHGIKCSLAMVAATRENLSPAAKAAKLRAVVAPDDRWLLFFTGTIVPDVDWIKFLRLRDRRTMAEAAFDLFAELRQSGTLPSHPRALDGLRDRLYGRPYRCESGEFEVDTEIRKRGFRIFIDDPEKRYVPRDHHITVLW